MIIDIIIVLFLAVGAFLGYKKGLIDVLTSIVAMVLSVILALLLQNPVANTLRTTNIGNSINKTVNTQITNVIENKNSDKDKNTFYFSMIDKMVSKEMVSTQAENITMFILKGLSFVIIFVIVSIIIIILRSVLNLVFELPILNSVNKFGGLGFGILKYAFIVYILLALIYFVQPISKVFQGISKHIENSYIASIIYKDNIIVKLFNENIK